MGRGNRANNLITPCRPMAMEAVAGGSPVTHVGKLYNLVASRVARALAVELPVVDATCMLVSRIGRAVADRENAAEVLHDDLVAGHICVYWAQRPAAGARSLGVALVWLAHRLTPHIHLVAENATGDAAKLRSSYLVVFSLVLHDLTAGYAIAMPAGAMPFVSLH